MSLEVIQQLLETRLSQTPDLPAITYENVNYNPTNGTPYISCELVPTSRRPVCMGPIPQHRYQGLFRVFVHTPEGQGRLEHNRYVDKIVQSFNTSTSMTKDGQTLRIEYIEPQRMIEEDPWVYTAINIGWYIYER